MRKTVLSPIGPVCLALAVLAGCDGPQAVPDFVPPKGDAAHGRELFVDYGCHACHDMPGVELPRREAEPPMAFALGVRMHRVRNYGDLLTAIANPDHTQSPKFLAAVKAAGREAEFVGMPDYSDRMTVKEFVDVATFLDTYYSQRMPRQYTSGTSD